MAPGTFLAEVRSHFNCKEVRKCCDDMGTKLHIIAMYSSWINGLLERSNKILLNTLKQLCAPGLGEDDYKKMTKKDILSNWPGHLDTAVKYLNNCILPSIKYSPNEIMFTLQGRPPPTDSPENIGLPTEQDISIHFALTEQQQLDSYVAIVDHTKAAFDAKL